MLRPDPYHINRNQLDQILEYTYNQYCTTKLPLENVKSTLDTVAEQLLNDPELGDGGRISKENFNNKFSRDTLAKTIDNAAQKQLSVGLENIPGLENLPLSPNDKIILIKYEDIYKKDPNHKLTPQESKELKDIFNKPEMKNALKKNFSTLMDKGVLRPKPGHKELKDDEKSDFLDKLVNQFTDFLTKESKEPTVNKESGVTGLLSQLAGSIAIPLQAFLGSRDFINQNPNFETSDAPLSMQDKIGDSQFGDSEGLNAEARTRNIEMGGNPEQSFMEELENNISDLSRTPTNKKTS